MSPANPKHCNMKFSFPQIRTKRAMKTYAFKHTGTHIYSKTRNHIKKHMHTHGPHQKIAYDCILNTFHCNSHVPSDDAKVAIVPRWSEAFVDTTPIRISVPTFFVQTHTHILKISTNTHRSSPIKTHTHTRVNTHEHAHVPNDEKHEMHTADQAGTTQRDLHSNTIYMSFTEMPKIIKKRPERIAKQQATIPHKLFRVIVFRQPSTNINH